MLIIKNPADEKLVHELKTDNKESIQKKFLKAKTAQPAWAKVPVSEKKKIIKKFNESLQANAGNLGEILTSEMGKPVSQSKGEIKAVSSRIEYFIANVERAISEETVFSDGLNLNELITYEPLGVIANISAWNYPYFVGANVFVPALLTGNSVLYKPSEFASLTGLEIARLLHEAGVPEEVFVPVIGKGDVGAELLRQDIKGVFFTGSRGTGERINLEVASRLLRAQLELGGKDPIYVTDGVNIKGAAEGIADGAFYNTGQSCCSVERIYVHEKVFDEFLAEFMGTVQTFIVGDPMDEKTYIGPLTRFEQLSVLEDQVEDALNHGGRVLCGGNKMDRPGYYFEPTVIVDVNHSMKLMRDESFGPIIGIQKVSSDEEAVELMNDTEFGLTSGVFCGDEGRARGILAQLNSGSVYWNCCDRVSPNLPWSGRGGSGIGSTLSTVGIQAFVQPKAWHLRAPA